MLFEASVKDWVREWSVPGLLGRRTLQARLLDNSERNDLDLFETEVVFDDQLPRSISVEVPDRIVRGTKELAVRTSVTPPPSGIKEVAFIFGPKADFEKAVAENRTLKAQTSDPGGHDWTATLPVPADAPAKLVVTARFTTGVGLTALHSEEVAVTDLPNPANAKAAPKPGAITGIVKVGDLLQAGLKVYLIDPMPPANKNPVLASTDTDAKGAFSFKDLEPKPYRIYCIKQDGINNRNADRRVTVEPEKTLKLELELKK